MAMVQEPNANSVMDFSTTGMISWVVACTMTMRTEPGNCVPNIWRCAVVSGISTVSSWSRPSKLWPLRSSTPATVNGVTIGANASGGLTKLGTGTLTLTGQAEGISRNEVVIGTSVALSGTLAYMGKAIERIFLPLMRLQLPEVRDIAMPAEGIFHNLILVRMRKRYPGHARKVMHAIWGLGQAMFSKVIVVVDADVDVQNVSETAWKALNNSPPTPGPVLPMEA